jgi:sugar phosphate permease
MGIAGVFFAGYISDKVFRARRMPVIVICLMLLGIFVFFLDDLPATRLSLSLSLMLIGLLLFGPDSLVSGTAAMILVQKKEQPPLQDLLMGWVHWEQ